MASVEALEAIEDEAWAVIRAAEDWEEGYNLTPKQFGQLVRAENRLRRNLSRYFLDIAPRAMRIVQWREYLQQAIKAADVVVDIDNTWAAGETETVYRVMFNDVLFMVSLGALSADVLHNIGVQLDTTSVEIQKAAGNLTEKLAQQITDYTKQQIAQSIKTSITLGEDIRQATERLQRNVSDLNQVRAQRIARTESVRSYSEGTLAYGAKTGATQKTWRTSRYKVCQICAPLDGQTVGIDEPFITKVGAIFNTPGHVNCRCRMVLEYAKVEKPVAQPDIAYSETVLPDGTLAGF